MNAERLTAYSIADPDVEDAITGLFDVRDRYFYLDNPTYVVGPLGSGNSRLLIKEGFMELVGELRPLGYMPRLTKEMDRYFITLRSSPPEQPSRGRLNLYLFLATLATIFFDGYLRSNNPVLINILMPGTPIYVNALLFTVAIVAIFGLHELGHKAAAVLRGTEASMPFFIPAPPGMGGTFGAVITQKEPPTNRDALFDLGFSGPLVGFLVTVLVAVIGLSWSFVVPLNEVNSWMGVFPEVRFQSIPFPVLLEILSGLVRPAPEGMVLLLHPVAFAAWVGCLVTFINLIPAWQLDGGHISRAVLGPSMHRVMSIVGVLLMLLAGYFMMGVMVAFFMMRTNAEEGGPLDDVSPLSTSRKAMVIIYLAMVVLTLVTLYTI